MKLEEIEKLMEEKPYLLIMGKGKLAKRFNTSPKVIEMARQFVKSKKTGNPKVPKILLFDLETAPMMAYVWNRWKQNIALNQTISESYIICWSAKWLYSPNVVGDVLTPEEALNMDDRRICASLYELINEADIVIAHNGDQADIPWMNSRFIIHGFPPPKPYYSIDTLKIAKKQFGFSSNKLDALATYFGFPNKIETNFELWKGCIHGIPEALEDMLTYNKQDVAILEEVYLKLRPWQKDHPNLANLLDSDVVMCPNCGSHDYEILEGEYYYTSVGKYQIYRCKHCGAVFRDRYSVRNKKVTQVRVVGR